MFHAGTLATNGKIQYNLFSIDTFFLNHYLPLCITNILNLLYFHIIMYSLWTTLHFCDVQLNSSACMYIRHLKSCDHRMTNENQTFPTTWSKLAYQLI